MGGIERRMNSADRGTGKRGDGKLEKDAEGRGRSKGGIGGIYDRRESSEGPAQTLSLIGRPPNPGQTALLTEITRSKRSRYPYSPLVYG